MTQHIAFVTFRDCPKLTEDDRLAAQALGTRGVRVSPAIWDDPVVTWRSFELVVIRSCWDYHLRAPAFRSWLDQLDREGVPALNDTATIRWNMDKRYLEELAHRGVPVPPTEYVVPESTEPLHGILDRRRWTRAVVKPTISLNGESTWLTSINSVEDERTFRRHAAGGTLMVQEFQPTIMADGEWSLLFFNGGFSHAALKRPRSDDFRVQERFGGTSAPATPRPAAIANAAAIIDLLPRVPTYARVDGVDTVNGFVLIELELIEPSLFLRTAPHAPEQLADAIVHHLR